MGLGGLYPTQGLFRAVKGILVKFSAITETFGRLSVIALNVLANISQQGKLMQESASNHHFNQLQFMQIMQQNQLKRLQRSCAEHFFLLKIDIKSRDNSTTTLHLARSVPEWL